MLLYLLLAVALAAKVPNKRPPDREKGEQLYQDNCWQCHGNKALGDGPALASMRSTAPALAGRVEKARFKELVAIIQQGKGDMPGYSAVMDRHDAERILEWLEKLDRATGADPDDKKKKKKSTTKPAQKTDEQEEQEEQEEQGEPEGGDAVEGGGEPG